MQSTLLPQDLKKRLDSFKTDDINEKQKFIEEIKTIHAPYQGDCINKIAAYSQDLNSEHKETLRTIVMNMSDENRSSVIRDVCMCFPEWREDLMDIVFNMMQLTMAQPEHINAIFDYATSDQQIELICLLIHNDAYIKFSQDRQRLEDIFNRIFNDYDVHAMKKSIIKRLEEMDKSTVKDNTAILLKYYEKSNSEKNKIELSNKVTSYIKTNSESFPVNISEIDKKTNLFINEIINYISNISDEAALNKTLIDSYAAQDTSIQNNVIQKLLENNEKFYFVCKFIQQILPISTPEQKESIIAVILNKDRKFLKENRNLGILELLVDIFPYCKNNEERQKDIIDKLIEIRRHESIDIIKEMFNRYAKDSEMQNFIIERVLLPYNKYSGTDKDFIASIMPFTTDKQKKIIVEKVVKLDDTSIEQLEYIKKIFKYYKADVDQQRLISALVKSQQNVCIDKMREICKSCTKESRDMVITYVKRKKFYYQMCYLVEILQYYDPMQKKDILNHIRQIPENIINEDFTYRSSLTFETLNFRQCIQYFETLMEVEPTQNYSFRDYLEKKTLQQEESKGHTM
jgi:hypothetical protein